ncbi:P-loop containing nucleoside triphosphate hydrolase protein [Syncephalis fuscata]|nr:P-loop containing nucleoside triphosphate hydrolase protein [Syncephalis fuscata]
MVVLDVAMGDATVIAATTSNDVATVEVQPSLGQFNPLGINIFKAIREFLECDLSFLHCQSNLERLSSRQSQLLSVLKECQQQLEEKIAHYIANGTNSDFQYNHQLETERYQLCQRILDTLSELLLQPTTTKLVARRFRPLLIELVARWIHQLSMNSEQNCNNNLNTPVIDSYCNGLNRSEMTFIAFSTLLPVAPQIKSLALNFFQIASSPLHRISDMVKSTDIKTIEDLRLMLRTSYRLLSSTSKGVLASNLNDLIDWSPICAAIEHTDEQIRYLANYCSSFIFGMSDAGRQLVLKECKQSADICIPLQDIDNEATDQQDLLDYSMIPAYFETPSLLKDVDLCRFITNTYLLSTPIHTELAPLSTLTVVTKSRLVLTATTRQQLHATALAVSIGAPILLQGPTGVGKTAIVEALALLTGRQHEDLIKVHIGDQTDSKILLGTYVATAEPGHFRWQPGVLTTAVKDGRWILVEDIDLAPSEVISVLTPLLESRELYIASRDERIVAHPEFKLFATRRMASTRTGQLTASMEDGRSIVAAGYWTPINVESLPHSELIELIHKRFPTLVAVAEAMIRVYDTVCSSRTNIRHRTNGAAIKELSMRDLIKWCERVDALFVEEYKRTGGEFSCSTMEQQKVRELLFHEAADIFCGMIPDDTAWRQALEEVGEALGVAGDQARCDMLDDNTARHIVRLGRVHLEADATKRGNNSNDLLADRPGSARTFARTQHASRLLEQIAVGVRRSEPILLVGETGCGKTTVVQNLADMLGRRLVVLNLSQQSDASDLLGGFKPVDGKVLAIPLKEQFEHLFTCTFSAKRNARFLSAVHDAYLKKKWPRFATLLLEATKMANERLMRQASPTHDTVTEAPKLDTDEKVRTKRQRVDHPELREQWQRFGEAAQEFDEQQQKMADRLIFNFVEGALVRAVRQGDWILLDEVNLAAAETLECLSGLLQDADGSLLLMEKGEAEPIKRHPNFRVFACMNPATDVGKKDLPPGLRSRFTELYVQPPDTRPADLLAIIRRYLANCAHGDEQAALDVAEFYTAVKLLNAEHRLADGANQRPHYSLRTLSRALTFVAYICPIYGLRRALYEGLSMTFLTLLNANILASSRVDEPIDVQHYILTPSVERNLHNLARVVMSHRFPVLIQGPTSAEHTDLQEYLGAYVSRDGQLVFEEGVLVRALRNGHWIVLDELNLAPSEVLEALNRLLDDNRELVIPETQEVIRPHPHFMLFATQNPAGLYGGRKVLSRAFRNRFLELHFDDIPQNELETILSQRCRAPPSYCKRIVEVYRQLQEQRRGTRIFDGKHGFATLRDLFRWAGRSADSYQMLAEQGFMLLAERTRRSDERAVVKRVLEQVMKATINEDELYNCEQLEEYQQYMNTTSTNNTTNIAWTKAMRRLFSLVTFCLRNNEPVLLVGETGCGKTTVCQMLAQIRSNGQLHIVNCHQNTETADLIGGQRPVRRRGEQISQFVTELRDYLQDTLNTQVDRPWDTLELDELVQLFEQFTTTLDPQKVAQFKQGLGRIRTLFEWHDGPLVQAMKQGDLFLLDEISLADDSVLERLNSAGGVELTAQSEFKFLATMNPGGDYGKKELSPALRNRFTEIWVPTVTDADDLIQIIDERFNDDVLIGYAQRIVHFLEWFGRQLPSSNIHTNNSHNSNTMETSLLRFSLRDILTWVEFINATVARIGAPLAFIHGASMVFLDGLGTYGSWASHISELRLEQLRKMALQQLINMNIHNDSTPLTVEQLSNTGTVTVDQTIGIQLGPFTLDMHHEIAPRPINFSMNAPTTASNLLRVLRAIQLRKPILLEGSPGVGKTSLIENLAAISGRSLVRINLSDQTDLIDLFGSDLPVEGGKSGEFAWRDAPFLSAMKAGHWVLLDEINLASQQVLEGLNSCLDHRGSVYLPELDITINQADTFRVFAAQNPVQQGGGRKGLPKSFLNRFTPVYVEALTQLDMQYICQHVFPNGNSLLYRDMIAFNAALHDETMIRRSFGRTGSPWEFNLRDIFRWLELMSSSQHGLRANKYQPEDFVELIYAGRMRTLADRQAVWQLFERVFNRRAQLPEQQRHMPTVTSNCLRIGDAQLPRESIIEGRAASIPLRLLHTQLPVLSSIMKCIEMQWMPILIGPSASGKTSLIKWLAQMTGHPLDIFCLNSGVDTTELLGGFEQLELARYQHAATRSLQRQLAIACKQLLLVDNTSVSNGNRHLYKLSTIRYELAQLFDDTKSMSRSLPFSSRFTAIVKRASQLVLDTSLLTGAIQDAQDLQRLESDTSIGRFEWVDGVLIKAAEQGRWLLLDQANRCNPSIIDRLNSLLEPNGTLLINERGLVNGSIKVVRPHPNFRLFMTIDPKYGELSRAMRNRGVEIVLLENGAATLTNDLLDLASMSQDLGLAMPPPPTTLSTTRHQLQAMEMKIERLQRGEPLTSPISTESVDTGLIRAHNPISGQLLIRDTTSWSIAVQNLPLSLYLLNTTLEDDADYSEAACLTYLELDTSTSPFVWPSYLSSLSSNSQNDQLKALLKEAVDLSRQHSLTRALYESGQLLMQRVFTEQPNQLNNLPALYDCSNDSVAWHAIHLPTDTEYQQVLAHYKSIRHCWLLLHRCHVMLLEDKQHVMTEMTPTADTSLLRLSYRVSRDELPADRLGHPAMRFIYPIAAHLHALMPQLLGMVITVEDNNNSNNRDETMSIMKRLVDHIDLWRSLTSRYSPMGYVVEVTRWIRRDIELLIEDVKRREQMIMLDMKLIELFNLFMQTAELQSGSKMKMIWQIRHPMLLQSTDLQTIEAILLEYSQVSTLDTMNEDNNDNNDYLTKTNVFIEERHLISEAMATLYLLERSSMSEERRELLESMQQSVMMLKEKRNETQEKVDLILAPLMEYDLLQKEMEILSQLFNVKLSKHGVTKIKQLLLPLYEQMKNSTTFSIVHLSLYRRLLWLIEDPSFLTSNSAYQRTLVEIYSSWMTRLWNNSGRHSFKWFSTKTSRSWIPSMVEGSALLYSQFSTAYILEFSYHLKSIPIGDYDIHSKRVNRLEQQLMHTNDYTTNQSDLSLLCMAMDQILQWLQWPSDISLLSLMYRKDQHQLSQLLHQLQQFINSLNEGTVHGLTAGVLLLITSALSLLATWLTTNTPPSLMDQGRLWTLISLISIELYVPDYASDPASETILNWEQLTRQQQQLTVIRSMRCDIQRILTGTEDNTRINELSSELATITKRQQSMMADRVPRPDNATTTQLMDVFNELRQVQQHHIDPRQIDQLLTDLVSNTPQSRASEALLQDNLEHYAARSLYKFPLFRDILEPLCGFLYQLKHGLRLVALSARQTTLNDVWISKALDTLLDIHTVSTTAQTRIDALLQLLEDAQDHSIRCNEQPQTIEALLLQLLERLRLIARQSITTRSTLLPAIHRALYIAQQQWQMAEDQRQREKIESSSLYKTSTSSIIKSIEHEAVDEAAEEEQEMNTLFPTFIEEFSQYITDDINGPPPVEENKEREKKKTADSIGFDESTVVQFSRWYIQYFLNDSNQHNESSSMLIDLWSSGYQLAGQLANTLTLNEPLTYPDESMNTRIMERIALHQQSRQFDLNTTPIKDIYKEANTSETIRVVEPLRKLEARLHELLIQWSDHAVLLQILEIATRLRQFSLSSPIMRFLTGLELLLFKAQDWEQYAAQHVSLSSHLSELTSLIVRWRELELNSWPHLLDLQDKSAADIAYRWWFDVFSATLAPLLLTGDTSNTAICVDEERLREVLSTLEQFIQGASLGQFIPRVQLIGAMYQHIYEVSKQPSRTASNTAVHTKMADALWQLYRYYRQFIPVIQTTIQQRREPIERQLKEAVKLASWKDVNVYALKQSAQKTHRQLTKFIRRYKEVLIEPVITTLTRPDLSFDQDRLLSPITATSLSISTVSSDQLVWPIEIEPQLVSSTSNRLVNLPRLVDRLQMICRQSLAHLFDTTLVNGMDEMTTTIIERSTELREASHTAISADPKCAKHWKQLKRKALAELLKQLRFIGISSRGTSQTLQEHMLHPCIHSDQLPDTNTDNLSYERADSYYFKLLAKLPHLQTAAHQANAELSVMDVQKGLGFTFSLMQSLMRQRQEAVRYNHQSIALKYAIQTWSSPMNTDVVIHPLIEDELTQHHDQLASMNMAVLPVEQ